LDPLLRPIALTFIGCVTAVALRAMSMASDSSRRALEEQVRLLRLQLTAGELRVADLERINHHLEQQVEWHTKLLDAGGSAPRQLDSGRG
jgi:hypothetical protein